jgi:hypothetical protein
MALSTYKAPYALRNIINQDPSVLATPQPRAEELAYAVAGEQAGIEAQAAQREEDISLKKLALAQKAEQAKESIQLKREALEDYEKGSKQALAFSTVGAGINTLRGYMNAKKIEDTTAKISAYFDKMGGFYERIGQNKDTQVADLTSQIEELKSPVYAASKKEGRESEANRFSLRKRWSE